MAVAPLSLCKQYAEEQIEWLEKAIEKMDNETKLPHIQPSVDLLLQENKELKEEIAKLREEDIVFQNPNWRQRIGESLGRLSRWERDDEKASILRKAANILLWDKQD